MKKFKLGGWHRLWIVISIVYLVPVVYFTFLSTPKSAQMYNFEENFQLSKIDYSDLYEGSLSEVSHDRFVKANSLLEKVKSARNEGYSYSEIEEYLIDQSYDKEIVSLSFLLLKDKAEKDGLKLYREHRKQIIIEGVMMWVFPVLLVYLIGLSVAWIYKGFTKKV